MQRHWQFIREECAAKQIWIWPGLSFLLCVLIIGRVIAIFQFNTALREDILLPIQIKISTSQNALFDSIISLPWAGQNSSETRSSKALLPKIMVFSVMQSNLAKQSTVLLSVENAPAKWVRIGDEIAPNARVVDIQPNVIDVLFQGQIFQLPLYLRRDKVWPVRS